MTASARHLEPECRLAVARPKYAVLHGECRGPHEVRLPPRPGQERGDLIMTVRCDCDCHQEARRRVGPLSTPSESPASAQAAPECTG
ncbi:hypothetical protein CGL27_26690 [Streptomyces sp. 11-1-2]|nr:hypothetical protein CGL27_26690 [Streptomyces sp. 11-1-2]